MQLKEKTDDNTYADDFKKNNQYLQQYWSVEEFQIICKGIVRGAQIV